MASLGGFSELDDLGTVGPTPGFNPACDRLQKMAMGFTGLPVTLRNRRAPMESMNS